ncbi:preprotein translocase subunit YajC [Succinispira mobilis]|uniref:preprotein translocase subunit YajC n=1 Tax=Succinispira mobilis TaxID=78120 RepID=UPI00035EB7F0|nr:preprotein translocase subunit YajC [Succinispira mobilis]
MPNDVIQTLTAVWPFLLMGLIFYFMLYKPQKKEQQKRASMLGALKKGDKVITVGGMYGVVTAIDDKKIVLKVADKVEIEFVKTAVNQVEGRSEE